MHRSLVIIVCLAVAMGLVFLQGGAFSGKEKAEGGAAKCGKGLIPMGDYTGEVMQTILEDRLEEPPFKPNFKNFKEKCPDTLVRRKGKCYKASGNKWVEVTSKCGKDKKKPNYVRNWQYFINWDRGGILSWNVKNAQQSTSNKQENNNSTNSDEEKCNRYIQLNNSSTYIQDKGGDPTKQRWQCEYDTRQPHYTSIKLEDVQWFCRGTHTANITNGTYTDNNQEGNFVDKWADTGCNHGMEHGTKQCVKCKMVKKNCKQYSTPANPRMPKECVQYE